MSNIIVNGFKTHIKNPQDPANILRLQLKYERALLKKLLILKNNKVCNSR